MNGIVGLYLLTISMNITACLIGIFTTLKLYFDLKRATPLILLMTSILASWGLCNLCLLLGNYIELKYSWSFFSLSQIFLVLTFTIFIYFSSTFSGDFTTWKIMAIIGYPAATFTLWITELSIKTPLIMSTLEYEGLTWCYWKGFSFLISGTGVLLTGYWVIKGLNDNLKYAYNAKQVQALQYMKFGSYFAFIIGPFAGFPGFILLRFGHNVGLGLLIYYVLAYSIISIGVFMLAFTYNRSKEISFLLPQKIEKLLVIHKSGVSLYSYDFRNSDGVGWNEQLVSGLVSATTSGISESLNINTEITEIKFIDRTVMMKVEGNIVFVLVTKNRSKFLEKALNRFALDFLNEYKEIQFSSKVFKLDNKVNISPMVRLSFGLPMP